MEKLSRKERERLARRAEILDAAKKVFARKRYHEATIAEIASEAEFAQGTLYLYFENKEHLFFSIIKEGIDRVIRKVSEVIESDEKDIIKKIENVVRAQLAFYEKDRDFLTFQVFEAGPPPNSPLKAEQRQQLTKLHQTYISLVAKLIDAAIKEGKLKAMDKDKLAQVLIGMVHLLTLQSILAGQEEELTANLKLIMELFLRGAGKGV